eukprot:1138465-Pelagomonas_calceolata.AAC.2
MNGGMPVRVQMEACQRVHKWRHASARTNIEMPLSVSMEACQQVHKWRHASECIKGGVTASVCRRASCRTFALASGGQDEMDHCACTHSFFPLHMLHAAGGALTGKYNRNPSEKARFNLFPGYMERYKTSMVKEAVIEYEKVAAKHGLTPSELALCWCQSRYV